MSLLPTRVWEITSLDHRHIRSLIFILYCRKQPAIPSLVNFKISWFLSSIINSHFLLNYAEPNDFRSLISTHWYLLSIYQKHWSVSKIISCVDELFTFRINMKNKSSGSDALTVRKNFFTKNWCRSSAYSTNFEVLISQIVF